MAKKNAATKNGPETIDVELEQLVAWPQNPRRSCAQEGLETLAASLKEQGLLQHLTVRPTAPTMKHPRRFEIICGERRWRAAQIAELPTLRVVVREDLELDDVRAREVALVENLEREDLSPLDEAETIQALRDQGVEVEEIAARLGKSPAYLYRRLGLCNLDVSARERLIAGEIPLGVAELLARMPRQEEQEAALKHLDNYQEITVGRARDVITREFRTRLADARWALDDAELVPEAGACSSCPKRTGAQPALPFDEESEDKCADRQCFAAKGEAHGQRLIALAKAEGAEVIAADAAKKVWSSSWSDPVGYVDLDAPVSRYGGSKKAWRGQLGKKRLAELDVVVAKNPHTGQVHQLVKRELVKKVLAADPKKSDPVLDSRSSSAGGYQQSPAEKKRKLVAKAKGLGHKRAAEELREKLGQPLTGKLPELLELLAQGVTERIYGAEVIECVAKRRGWVESSEEPSDVVRRAASGAPEQVVAVLLELLVEEQLRQLGTTYDDDSPERFVARLMAYVGVDWLAHEKAAIEELEAKLAKKKAAKKKKSKKAGATKASKRAPAKDDEDESDLDEYPEDNGADE